MKIRLLFVVLCFFIGTTNTFSQQQIGQDIDGEAAFDYSGHSVSLSSDGSIVSCTPFSPSVDVVLANTNCDSLSDLTIIVSQDSLEIDMDSAIFVSDGGYFTLSNLSVGDLVGNALMSFGVTSVNTNLIVDSIINNDKVAIQAIEPISGLSLGSFTISNNLGGGISVFVVSVEDGNNFTNYGNSSTVTLTNLFTNPNSGTLNFVSTIISELNDINIQNFDEQISCICSTVYTNIPISSCDNYLWNGLLIDSTGLYYDSLTTILGCDSIIILDINIYNSSNDSVLVTACDQFNWDGMVYNTSGIYTNYYTSVYGCDSIVTLVLTINNSSTNTISISACNSYDWDGISYDSSGFYTNVYSRTNGCDSIVNLDLTINNSTINYPTIVACDSYDWNGLTYDSSGTYVNTFTDLNGCDSLVILDLVINYSFINNLTVTSCDNYLWEGINYVTSGLYTNIYTALNGCDSVVNLDLTINNSSNTNQSFVVCDSLLWNGQVYTNTGNYSFVTTNEYGCDSTVNLSLIVNYSSVVYDTVDICVDEFYSVGSSVYSESGDYVDNIISANGCISTIYTNLTVADSLLVSIVQVNPDLTSIVTGGVQPYSYTWNTQEITSSITPMSNGLYSLYVTDALGCFTDTAFFQFNNLPTEINDQIISELNLYPNPTSGMFKLEFNMNLVSDYNIKVINVIGELVYEDNLKQFRGKYSKVYDMSYLPKSIYFIEINTPYGIVNKKLIVQ